MTSPGLSRTRTPVNRPERPLGAAEPTLTARSVEAPRVTAEHTSRRRALRPSPPFMRGTPPSVTVETRLCKSASSRSCRERRRASAAGVFFDVVLHDEERLRDSRAVSLDKDPSQKESAHDFFVRTGAASRGLTGLTLRGRSFENASFQGETSRRRGARGRADVVVCRRCRGATPQLNDARGPSPGRVARRHNCRSLRQRSFRPAARRGDSAVDSASATRVECFAGE